MKIHPIPALADNYIWLLQANQQAAVIDPGDAAPVLAYLHEHQLTLNSILITHHHPDHIGGVRQLVNAYHPDVYGPESIAVVNYPVNNGDCIQLAALNNTRLQVFAIPGHTLDHIAYYDGKNLWCGDTLFLAGCGRLFEGTPEQMYLSLEKIMHLPEDTSIFCAHEYTLANLKFASTVEPQNKAIQQRIAHTSDLRTKNLPTVPAKLSEELATNPFLRTKQADVIKAAETHIGKACPTPIDVFATLRAWKDQF